MPMQEKMSLFMRLDLAAFVPRAAVVQHGFRLMAFAGEVRSSVVGPPFASGSSLGRFTSVQGRDRCRQTEWMCGHGRGLGVVVR